jgi:hypothetical protein
MNSGVVSGVVACVVLAFRMKQLAETSMTLSTLRHDPDNGWDLSSWSRTQNYRNKKIHFKFHILTRANLKGVPQKN